MMSVVLVDDNESAFSESSGLSLLSGIIDSQSPIGSAGSVGPKTGKRGRRKKAEPKPKIEPPFIYQCHLKVQQYKFLKKKNERF